MTKIMKSDKSESGDSHSVSEDESNISNEIEEVDGRTLFSYYKMFGYDLTDYNPVNICPPADENKEVALDDYKRYFAAKEYLQWIVSPKDARSALIEHLSAISCYGSKAVREMVIVNMQSTSVLHYELQTFGEKREVCLSFSLSQGDAKNSDHVPYAWDIEEKPKTMFRNEKKHLIIPNSNIISTCFKCRGTGVIGCRECRTRVRNR